jgi:hypothetical protein
MRRRKGDGGRASSDCQGFLRGCNVTVVVKGNDLVETTQTARPDTEYIMTLYGAMDPPQRIDETLVIFCVTRGWAKGPKIEATVIQTAWPHRNCGFTAGVGNCSSCKKPFSENRSPQ